MDPVKVQGITNWPVPMTVKQVRGFLEFGNFYRRFINHYAEISRPLNDLTKKDAPFEWSAKCQEAFKELKRRFTTAPVMRMPDTTQPFVIKSDTSLTTTAAVLCQQDVNGDWHPVAYLFQSLLPAERNYEIYDRELLAIVRALEAWRHYIMGGPHAVRILTDHKNLTYFRSPQKLNRQQARWHLFLLQFNYVLHHCPGSQLVQADALTRTTHPTHTKDDNVDIILLTHDKFAQGTSTLLTRQLFINALDELDSVALDDTVFDCIRTLAADNPFAKTIRHALTDRIYPIPGCLDRELWDDNDGLLTYDSRVYVPSNLILRRTITQAYHDTATAGHPGQFKTGELISHDFYWPGLYSFIFSYIRGCSQCQQYKVNMHPTAPPLQLIKPKYCSRPFAFCTCDFITALPESHTYDSLMVMVDHDATKGVILIPCTKSVDTIQTATLFHEHIFK